ncbi:sensor histidine kinase, partial [Bacteroidota bacterium]
ERETQFNKVSIQDNGVGFDETTGNKIFDTKSFYTTSGINNEAGSGLGLLLSKEFVEINGGTIWAESEPEKGATFFFTLPVADLK